MNYSFDSNDSTLISWIEGAQQTEFPIQNLPFGIFSIKGGEKHVGVAIGNKIIDLYQLYEANFLNGLNAFSASDFKSDYLNPLMSKGRAEAGKLRKRISDLLREGNDELKAHIRRAQILINMQEVQLHLPVQIGNYTDFYSSIDHATNVGLMFRGKENALMPNWKYIPVGYHGRASSIVVSPAQIKRPMGQMLPKDSETPVFGKSKLLDFELEVAFVSCKSNNLGEAVSIQEAEDYIFGLCLFNDLSARDIQKWEYVPLGPFLGKNFGSVISPWIVTLDALEPFRQEGYKQEPEPFDYLKYEGKGNVNIDLQVSIKPEGTNEKVVSHSNFKYMYWNMMQQLAHHTVNGCNVQVGDMYASGTISGPEPHEFGSLLEITWQGTKPIVYDDGVERKFLNDGDECIIRGYADKGNYKLGFGECKVRILP